MRIFFNQTRFRAYGQRASPQQRKMERLAVQFKYTATLTACLCNIHRVIILTKGQDPIDVLQ